jgi:uncharacterized membrane protein
MSASRSAADKERGRRYLRRLEVLVDVVFALLIWEIVSNLPHPDGMQLSLASLGQFLEGNLDLVMVIIGVVIVINYWAQNNALCGELEATNGTHATLSIMQLFCLLFYVYAVSLGMQFDGDALALAMQSFMLLLAGLVGLVAWAYAVRDGRLLADYTTTEDVNALLIRSLAEPMTALITLPVAFVSAGWWELAWLIYIPLAWLLRRRSEALQRVFKVSDHREDPG